MTLIHVQHGTVFIHCQPKFLQPVGTKVVMLERKVQISLVLQNPFWWLRRSLLIFPLIPQEHLLLGTVHHYSQPLWDAQVPQSCEPLSCQSDTVFPAAFFHILRRAIVQCILDLHIQNFL